MVHRRYADSMKTCWPAKTRNVFDQIQRQLKYCEGCFVESFREDYLKNIKEIRGIVF